MSQNDPNYPNYLSNSLPELSGPTMPRSIAADVNSIRISQNPYQHSSVQEMSDPSLVRDAQIYVLDESIVELPMDYLKKKKMDWKKVAGFIALNPFPDLFCMKSGFSIDDLQYKMFSSRIPDMDVQIPPSDYDILKKLCPD